jgi:hypothetical protein
MKFKRNDIYLILGIVIIAAIAGLYIFLNRKQGGVAILKYNETQSMEIDLSKDQKIDMQSNGINIHLDVKDDSIAFVHSECPDHICERFGYIKNVGESAICLPAKASVTIIKE